MPVAQIGDLNIHGAHPHRLADRIPGATWERFPEAGHGFFWEYPEALVDLLSDFVMAVGKQNSGGRLSVDVTGFVDAAWHTLSAIIRSAD